MPSENKQGASVPERRKLSESLTSFALGAGCMIVLFYTMVLRDMQKDIRILGIHVQDMNALLLREGIATPTDSTVGPTYVSAQVQRDLLQDKDAGGDASSDNPCPGHERRGTDGTDRDRGKDYRGGEGARDEGSEPASGSFDRTRKSVE